MFTQMKQFGKIMCTFALAIVLGAWFGGCSGCQSPSTVDAPASNLDVKFNVLDISETPSDGKVIVVVQYSQGGTAVKVASNATTSCNGVTLTYNDLLFGYAERVPQVAVGGNYNFRHSRTGVNTDVSVPVPPRPVFAAPTVAGSTLARTNNFTIHYVAGTGTSIRGNASDPTNSKNNTQPDDGTHDGLDVSGFNAGTGTLGITRVLENPISGTGFLSAAKKFETNKTINITWQ